MIIAGIFRVSEVFWNLDINTVKYLLKTDKTRQFYGSTYLHHNFWQTLGRYMQLNLIVTYV